MYLYELNQNQKLCMGVLSLFRLGRGICLFGSLFHCFCFGGTFILGVICNMVLYLMFGRVFSVDETIVSLLLMYGLGDSFMPPNY